MPPISLSFATGLAVCAQAQTNLVPFAWDEDTIAQSVDRLARLGVNRIRAALAGRTRDGKRWNEPPVTRTEKSAFKMEPWVAARPDNLEDPGYEDHYPFPWGEKRLWPARIADNRRRLAWEISMAGCYQTTGERGDWALLLEAKQ